MKETVRIKDIAEKAQVSVGTVDRVIHNRGRVAEEVREKVLKIIKEMDYEPNLIARSLGTNKSYRIAALIPDPNLDSYWIAPKSGIQKAAKEMKGYGISVHLHVYDLHQVASFLEKAYDVTESKPDAILIAPLFYRESLPFFTQWQEMGIPFVLINTQINESQPLSYIGQDSYQSGFLAGKLIHYGQSEPGTLLVVHIAEDIANSAHLIKKEQGFRDYFAQAEVAVGHPSVLTGDLPNPTDSLFEQRLDYLFAECPNIKGIFVTTSKAYEIASYLQKRQRTGIRLVGYDLLEKNLIYLNKGIIDFLINQNPKGQGYWGIVSITEHIALKKKVNAVKYLPLDIITKENLHYYIEADN